MSTPPPEPGWSGDMLDRPEMVAEFAGQLRKVLSDQAEFVARVRRDAEAMWRANPPAGYGSFETWWRHRWVAGPFAEIQTLLEKASSLTFALEARYRRGRHEIPAARLAAKEAALRAKQGPALTRGTTDTSRPAQPRAAGPPPAAESGDFMDLIRRNRPA